MLLNSKRSVARKGRSTLISAKVFESVVVESARAQKRTAGRGQTRGYRQSYHSR